VTLFGTKVRKNCSIKHFAILQNLTERCKLGPHILLFAYFLICYVDNYSNLFRIYLSWRAFWAADVCRTPSRPLCTHADRLQLFHLQKNAVSFHNDSWETRFRLKLTIVWIAGEKRVHEALCCLWTYCTTDIDERFSNVFELFDCKLHCFVCSIVFMTTYVYE